MTRSDSTVFVTRLDQVMTLTRRACDSDSTKMTREHHWKFAFPKVFMTKIKDFKKIREIMSLRGMYEQLQYHVCSVA